VRLGAIRLLQPWPDHLERTETLLLKYEAMDAADAPLVVLSKIYPEAKIITTDRADFTVYRRFRAQKLSVVWPG
jgi:hypothetical protein